MTLAGQLDQQEDKRQQIISESEDPQEQKRAQHKEKVDELSKQPPTETLTLKETAAPDKDEPLTDSMN